MGLDSIPACVHGPWLLVALAAMGLVVGVLTGLFGIGGGLLATPLMNALLGIPYPLAVGSSLSFVIGASSSGLSRHVRMGNVEFRSGLLLSLGAVGGAAVGVLLHQELKHWMGTEAQFDAAMNLLFVTLLLVTAALVWREPQRQAGHRTLLQRLPLGPHVTLMTYRGQGPDRQSIELPHVSLPGLLLSGLAVGTMTSVMGVGGGVLFMPLLLVVVGLGAHQAVGTSLLVVIFASVSGVIGHGLLGHVSLWIALALLSGSVVGVQIGAAINQRLHARGLRRYFALLVLAVAAYLAVVLLRS